MKRSRQKRFQFSAPLLFSASAVALLLLAGHPAFADQQSGDVCMGTLYGAANNGAKLNCTANDITIAFAKDVTPEFCVQDQFFNLTATFVVELSGGGNNQTRYDLGLYFQTNGGASARQGTCTVAAIQPGDPGYRNFDASPDTCGDIRTDVNPIDAVVHFDNVKCVDTDGDGFVNLPNCTSWRQPGSNGVCDSALDAFPGTSSKCNCDDTFNLPVRVRPADATMTKEAIEACVTFRVTVQNPTNNANGQPNPRTVNLTALSDDKYGDVANAANANLCFTTCGQTGNTCGGTGSGSFPATITPGSQYQCTFGAKVPSSSSNQTDIVTATLQDASDNSAITPSPADDATVLVNLNPL
jgi:hypothetical protein